MTCQDCAQFRAVLAQTDEELEAALGEVRSLRAENARLQKQIEEIMMDTSHSAGAMQEKIRRLEDELARCKARGPERVIDPEGPYTALPGRGRRNGSGPWGGAGRAK